MGMGEGIRNSWNPSQYGGRCRASRFGKTGDSRGQTLDHVISKGKICRDELPLASCGYERLVDAVGPEGGWIGRRSGSPRGKLARSSEWYTWGQEVCPRSFCWKVGGW